MAELAEADAAFEAPRPARVTSDSPTLRLGAYEGPLDLLLELARAQRVDLTRVSVLTLAEQFVTAVEAAIDGRRVPLAALGDWLVAAASLMLLRSRLLLPAGTPANREAEREAAALRRRLADREAVRRLAAWLERRPQLGRDVFGRGAREEVLGPPVADSTELLRACLRLLALPARDRVYRPTPPALWRVPEALVRMRQLLTNLPQGGAALARFLPPVGPGPTAALQRRAALASTLVAALELGRAGELALEQHEAFGAIGVRVATCETPTASTPTAVAASPLRSPPAGPGTALATLSSAARPTTERTEPIWDAS